MAYTLVFNWAEATNGAATTAKDTSGCDLLWAFSTAEGGTDPTLSDSNGNTWTQKTAYNDGSNRRVRAFFCQAPTVGSGHTFTPGPLFAKCTIGILGFSGSAATPADGENGSGSDNVATMATGSVTPSQDNDVCCAGWGFQSLGGITTGTVDVGFTAVDFLTDGANYGIKTAYLIQTTATAKNVTWTPGGGNIYGACSQSDFKATGGGGGSTFGPIVDGGSVVKGGLIRGGRIVAHAPMPLCRRASGIYVPATYRKVA